MQKIIIVNSGSASKKYALYDGHILLVSFHFEENKNSGGKDYLLNLKKDNNFSKETSVSAEDYERAFDYSIDFLIENKYLENEEEIKGVVFRIVAPGSYFTSDRIINSEFLDKLEEIKDQSPLHITKMQEEFGQVSARLKNTKMIGVSDSRFHKTMPEKAAIYGLPTEITNDLEIRRYGYHGISVGSIVDQIKSQKGQVPEKMIICHLGGGSSITALKNGETIENSMGYSPLEGLPMATRVGNIDVGAILALAEKMDLEWSEIRDIMYNKSGLKGISNYSNDIRVLLSAGKEHENLSKLALEKYAYEIKKTIGSYVAILGGLDWLIFAGTVGERSAPIRQMICEELNCLGIEIDPKANILMTNGAGYINMPNAEIPIEIMYTNEVEEMIKRAIELI